MSTRTSTQSTGVLAKLAAVSTAIVAVAAAVLAYRATSSMAAVSGAVDHRWSWLAPLVIEGGLVAV